MNIYWVKNEDTEKSIRDYLIINDYNNFFYVGDVNVFALNSTQIRLYDKMWYRYNDYKKVMYIPFKINNTLVKIKTASTHKINLYS